MFADVELARRIERAEARLTAAIAGAVPEPTALVRELDGAVAAFVRRGSPIDKVIGLGFTPLDEHVLGEIEAAWRERGEPVRIELATLADAAALATLGARGYVLQGFENVLGLRLGDRPDVPPPDGLQVDRVTTSTGGLWGQIAVDGFAAPDGTGASAEEHGRDELEQVMGDFARVPGIRRYLARVEGDPAGAASFRIDDGIAQLCGATTLRRFRRRGVQRALLEARLAEARAAGCTLAVVTTAPGSQSQANVQRQGFALLYSRAVLVRA